MNSSTESSNPQQGSSVFKEDLEYLHRIPLLKKLDYESLKLLAMLSKRAEFIEGDELMIQGEDDGDAFYLIAGNVEVMHHRQGIDHRVSSFGPGSFFGGLALLTKSVRLFTLRASEKTTVLRLTRTGFQKALQKHPESYGKVARSLAAELREWDRRRLAAAPDSADLVALAGVSLL